MPVAIDELLGEVAHSDIVSEQLQFFVCGGGDGGGGWDVAVGV